MNYKLLVKELIVKGWSHRQIEEEVKRQGGSISIATVSEIRKSMGLSLPNPNKPVDRNDSDSDTETGIQSEEFDLVKNEGTITARTNKEIKSLDDLIEVCNIDTKVWQIDRYVCNKRGVAAKGEDGKLEGQDIFQVKAWMSKIKEPTIEMLSESVVEVLSELSEGRGDDWQPTQNIEPNGQRLLELAFYDVHVGKQDVDGDYNVEDIYLSMVEDAIDRGEIEGVDRVLFTVGNDFFHVDNPFGSTTKGTNVSPSDELFNLFPLGQKIIIQSIEMMLERLGVPIDVVVVWGNHDMAASFFLGQVIWSWFRANELVYVDNDNKQRKYYQYGNCMLCLDHGELPKRVSYGQLMATEEPEMRADTRYREAHLAHKHTREEQEHMGTITKRMSSSGPTDKRHENSGYVGNLRAGTSFVRDYEYGKIGEFYYPVERYI